MTTLIDELYRRISEQPNVIAVVDNGVEIRNEQLWQHVLRFVEVFEQQKISRLGIYLENSLDWIAIDLACLYLEIPLVPIPQFFSERQQQHIIEDVSVDAIVCKDGLNKPWCAGFEAVSLAFTDSTLLRATQHHVVKHTLPKGTAKITYTSGSSGSPRGVCLAASLLHDTSFALKTAIGSNYFKRHLSVLPYTTLLENLAGVYLPLLSGVTIHCAPMDQIGILASFDVDINAFINSFNNTSPSSLIVSPQLLELLCQLTSNKLLDVSNLTFIAVGGAHSSQQLLNQAAELGLPVYQGYGLSEAGSVVSLSTPEDNQLGRVGKPLSHLKVTISNDKEIQLSANQFGQYLGEAIDFPTEINTKDIGEIDQAGFLSIKGRSKNMFILANGRNINPEWLETELLQQTCIKQCVVHGEAEDFVSAYVVASSEQISQQLINEAIQQANSSLPAYAHIKQWQTVAAFSVEQGTLTTTGKVIREAVVERYLTHNQQAEFCIN